MKNATIFLAKCLASTYFTVPSGTTYLITSKDYKQPLAGPTQLLQLCLKGLQNLRLKL